MRLKFVSALIITLIVSLLHGETRKKNVCSEPAALIPSSSNMLIEIPDITKTINYIKSNPDHTVICDWIFNYSHILNEIMDRTGINILDQNDFRKTGIKINGTMYVANNSGSDTRENIFYIP